MIPVEEPLEEARHAGTDKGVPGTCCSPKTEARYRYLWDSCRAGGA